MVHPVSQTEVSLKLFMSRSPFYRNIESHSPYPTDTPVPTLTPSPLPPNVYRQHSNAVITSKKRPPRPPSRTGSLNPNSTSKYRPKSSIATTRRSSDLPTQPLSLPAPNHSRSRAGSMLSNPCPTPSASSTCSINLFVSQEEIDLILRNLDIKQEE